MANFQKGMTQTLFRRHIALTNEYGAWVFLLSPLIIGIFAGGAWSFTTGYLVVAALVGFLIRHPITIIIKVYSGRRPRHDLPAAVFWTLVYAVVGALMVAGLVTRGFGYLLYLVIPGIPIFVWHLYLVSRRSERRQIGIEVVATGVFALAAPAALWVGQGEPLSIGWALWLLTWFQSAASIVYAYLRLEQRQLKELPLVPMRLKMARRALMYTTFNLVAVIGLSSGGVLPAWLFVPYLIQFAEVLWGTFNPAIGLRPMAIGFRQLAVSTLFTLAFILVWTV
jgi:hypothetical protein